MASNSEADRPRTAARSVDLSWDATDFDHEQGQRRDWKKLFLVAGLGLLSWVATYVGMLELIEANMGELPLVHKAIIGFSVAMLMVMVVWLLDQMFSDIGWVARGLYAAGYVFLTLISVGFGFGFYWKVLESRSEASRSAESAVGQVQTSLHAAMTRLEQLQGTLDSLTAISAQKAESERASGASCPNSRPGDGPRRKLRDDDAGRFRFAADFVKGRIGAVKADIGALDGDLARIVKDDKSTIDARSGTRNDFMRNLGRKLDMTVAGFNAFRSDPQLRQIRIDLNERADKVTFIDSKGGTYTCPDSQLTTALKGVVRAIDELPQLEKPRIAAVEGSEAVIEAFRRLTATFHGALAFKLPPSPEELRELQKKAVQSLESSQPAQARINAMAEQAGLSRRDYIPLAIAIFVDLCLLLVSMRRGTHRLQGLVSKMRAAERGPVIQILARFNEIHRDQQIRENFELFRHVVFDFHGDYYAAVPLNAPYRPNPANANQRLGYGVSDAHELVQEAHLLANLFASFEKERIFSRVHSPLLSTRTVQKRLRRQGSKFANAEAFRLYRFRDGAWSEFILGAVMGAARRVEAEKRRNRLQRELFGDDLPTLDPGTDLKAAPWPRGRPAQGSPGAAPSYPYLVGGTACAGPRPHEPGPRPMAASRGAPAAGPFGQAAPAPSLRPAAGLGGAPAPSGAPPRGPIDDAPPGAGSERAADGAAEPPRYSMARRPAPWPRAAEAAAAEVQPAVRPANSNTAPGPCAEPATPPHHGVMPQVENVVAHPAASRPAPPAALDGVPAMALEPDGPQAQSRAERTVTVAATRETLTWTLPAGEAAGLPAALIRPASATEASGVGAIEARSVPTSATSGLPPPDQPEERRASAAAAPVIAIGDAAAELAVRADRQAWDGARAEGWEREQQAALGPEAAVGDDPLPMLLRPQPARRDA